MLIGLLLLASLVWIGISKMNRWRIEGDGFSVNAARRISELVDRRVSFSRFQQTGTDQLSNAVVTVTPTHRDLIDSLSLERLTGQFATGSWLANDWTLRSLRIRKTDITFQPNKILDANTITVVPVAPVDRGGNASQGFRLSMNSDPTAVVLEGGRLDEVNLTWPGPDGTPETLSKMEGDFIVADQTVKFTFINGLLDTAGWPTLPVHQINAQLSGTSLQIISARLGLTAEHSVRLSGSAELVPDGTLKLAANFEPILLKHILPAAWGSSVLGTFQAENTTWLSQFSGGTTPPPPPATLSGAFRVKGFVLRGFAFLEKIANLLRNPDLTIVEFPNLNGEFSWTPVATQLTNLTAVTQDGLLRLKANLTAVPGANLTGQITIEANEAYFAGLPRDEVTLFTRDTEDWRSLTFKINGPAESSLIDDIGVAQPVIIRSRPSEGMPKMTLPAGTVLPPSAPAPTPAKTMAPASAPSAPRPRPLPLPPTPLRPASHKELERDFNKLLEEAKPSRKTPPQLSPGQP